jgi:hypothetical protein
MRKLAINMLYPLWKRYKSESFSTLARLCESSIDFLEALLTTDVEKMASPKKWREWLGQRLSPRSGPVMEPEVI